MAYQNFYATKTQNSIGASDTVIAVQTIPTVTSGRLILEPRNAAQREIISFTGVAGNTLTGVSRGLFGTTAKPHGSGVLLEMNLFAQDLVDAINVPNTIVQRSTEQSLDFVASGLVWTGNSYGGSLIASMTAGVIYISGIRLAISAVVSRAFTANRDTYIDIANNGVISYTEVNNNLASPALAANSVRIAIVVTGASVANVGAINQGQIGKLLPIASSTPYSVTDSLGNIICPRDPNRKLLGYRQLIAIPATITTATADVVGLSVPVIVPEGRKVKISISIPQVYGTNGSRFNGNIAEGATVLNSVYHHIDSNGVSAYWDAVTDPTVGLHTYKLAASLTTGTATIFSDTSTAQASIKIELE